VDVNDDQVYVRLPGVLVDVSDGRVQVDVSGVDIDIFGRIQHHH
jgi:hypothetical protein